MTRRDIVALGTAASMLICAPLGASAQLDQRAQPSDRKQPRLLERYLIPPDPPGPNAAWFVAPFSRETESGRVGVAFFNPRSPGGGPRGTGDPDTDDPNSMAWLGWLGFGFAAEWGDPAKRTRTN
jgi:hypothetical protein